MPSGLDPETDLRNARERAFLLRGSIDLHTRPTGRRTLDDCTNLPAAIHHDPSLAQDEPGTLNDFSDPRAVRRNLVCALARRPLSARRRRAVGRHELLLTEVTGPIELRHDETPE